MYIEVRVQWTIIILQNAFTIINSEHIINNNNNIIVIYDVIYIYIHLQSASILLCK